VVGGTVKGLERIGARGEPVAEFVSGRSSFVEPLPYSLSYASNLKRGDHIVLFYDNLVVAAEYLCAYIEATIKRNQPTCFVGLSRRRYETVFEQVGIEVNELENGGYLKHISTKEFCLQNGSFSEDKMLETIENLLTITSGLGSKEVRFIIMNSASGGRMAAPGIMECEKALGNLGQYPICVMCCYSSNMAIVNEPKPYFFSELLKSHNHCLFQGVGIPTADLVGKF